MNETTSVDKEELLALLLAERGLGRARADTIQPRDRSLDPPPLSCAQQRLWFLDQLEPGSSFYNIPEAIRLCGALDVKAFEHSLNEIIRRHEVLRTRFVSRNGQPVQVIEPQLTLSVPVQDLRAWPAAAREQEIARLANEEAQQPFDLSTGPLIRAGLLRTSQAEHVLLLTLHHIASDGWSTEILLREFIALYEAFAHGRPSPLPALKIQYADFACWQRQRLQGEGLSGQLAYWKERLNGAPALLELPADHPRPSLQSYRGGVYNLVIPPDLGPPLNALCRKHNVTPFMLFLVAFKLLLYRYSGQSDLCVGTTIANRNRMEIEALIGFFVNTLVLRTDLSGNPRFPELLQRVREAALGAQANQDLPFEQLVEELQPRRDLSHAPLFQVMFDLQTSSGQAFDTGNLQLSAIAQEDTTAKFDLSLTMGEGQNGWMALWEYSSDLFERGTIERMAGHFNHLLAGSAATPEARISELSLLSEAERRCMLVEWNATEAPYPHGRNLFQLFAAQAAETPDHIAVACGDARLSYGDLHTRATRLAQGLTARGISPETMVAVLAERSIELLTMTLAVFKAGGVYLPLDPRHPVQRLAEIITLSQARVVLTSVEMAAQAVEGLALTEQPRPEVLTTERLLTEEWPDDNAPACACGDHLAYVIYTSGSTGVPKGAMVTYEGMLNHLWSKIPMLGLTAEDAVAQTASQCFDISVWQFLTALLCGARVQIIPDEVAHDPERLLAEVEARGVTVLESVPAVIGAMLASAPRDLCRLRWLLPTGEALSPGLARDWLARYPDIPLLNAYGPAECADDVAMHRIAEPPPEQTAHMPIGRPIANTRLYIVDPFMAPCPVGVSGELCVAGVGVGRGYLNDPAHTAEVFVPDPFSSAPGSRLYRTGDRARYGSDGIIEYLGRLDEQVKLRGFRIEPGEVEARLRAHPKVREAVVVVREDGGEKRLVGYVVAARPPLDAEALRAHLKASLPEYMVPAAFVSLERLPLTANGKVDRRALPAPALAACPDDYVPPRTPTEEVLCGIWAEMLRLERVGIHDNFFELGGHSLLATQVISRVRQIFQMDPPLRVVFETPTIAGLAGVLIAHEPAPGHVEAVAALHREIDKLSTEDIQALIRTRERLQE